MNAPLPEATPAASGTAPMSTAAPARRVPGLPAPRWWAVALRGVLAILFGVLALLMPVAAMYSLALFFSAYLLADGVFGLVSAARGAPGRGWLVAEALLSLAMGALAFLFPAGAVLGFVLATAAWALLSGGAMIAAAFRQAEGRAWLVLGGIVSILFGVVLVLAPVLGALVLTWWLAGYAFAFGVTLVALGFRLRGRGASAA